MIVALINKVNGNFIITDFVEYTQQDLKLFKNYVILDELTRTIYNTLVNKYDKVYIKEEDVLKHFANKDSFIFIKNDVKHREDVDANKTQLDIEKNKLYKELDSTVLCTTHEIQFLDYIHYINLFNYFASKNIFITEENKEDKYIEILELDDETAVNKLELFLTLQDKIEIFLEKNQYHIDLKEQIEYADEEELEKLKEEILPKVII